MTTETASGWEGILDPGERILWQGRPRPGLSLRGFSPIEAGMGAFFMVFALVWINMTLEIGNSFRDAPGFVRLFPLFGVIFFVAGFWIAIGGLLWQSFLLTRTHYTLTDRRGFIAVDHPFAGRKLSDYRIRPETELKLYDGSPGAVQFATRRVTSTQYRTHSVNPGVGPRRMTRTNREVPVFFDRIDDPRRVYRLLREVQTGAASGADQ